jgi:hypothetical protein
MNFDFEKYILNEHKRIVEKEKEYMAINESMQSITNLMQYNNLSVEMQLQVINDHLIKIKELDNVRIREVVSED